MNILIVSSLYPPHVIGGAEIVAHRHARELAKRGHRVSVFAGRFSTPNVQPGGIDIEVVDDIRVYRTVLRSLDLGDGCYREETANWLRSIVAAEQIEVVQFHNLAGLGANLIPEARRLGLKTVLTLHDHWGFCLTNTRLRKSGELCHDHEECYKCASFFTNQDGVELPIRLRRDYMAWCVAQADHLVSPSRYLATAYAQAGFDNINIAVQSNGIDLPRFTGIDKKPSGKLRFTVIGYLGEHKGLPLMMEAVQRLVHLSNLDDKWSLKLVGGGHLKDWLSKQVDKLDRGVDVHFLGKLPANEMPALYAETDVLVLPSIWPENEAVVLLEAIATGTAQLASDHGGNVELVDHEKSGFLFQPGSVDALVDALLRLVEQPALAGQFGEYNRQRRGNFGETASVDFYETLYSLPGQSERRGPARPLVIVGGGWPSPGATYLVNFLATMSKQGIQPLLIHSDYATPEIWEEAAAMWLWSTDNAERLVLRAMRAHLPVVCPKGFALTDGIALVFGCALTYGSFVEAAAILNVLVEKREFRHSLMAAADDAADLLAQAVDGAAYHYSFCNKARWSADVGDRESP
jgi:glycosyltransferase involved in cell wall biosynthesis